MENLRESVDRELMSGRIIQAVKLYREATGCALREAMDFVRERDAELGRGRPSA
ncbi:hypothetical protein [Kitasatospora sp. NPDC056184]|uniref:hypothetical protein n=1 Tax=Kitasatospora sp. NPDC056184 TaxID=3345738 RepID=UPI0035D9F86C